MQHAQILHTEFPSNENPFYRRNLLPYWIKCFTWFYMITGVAGVVVPFLILLTVPSQLAFHFESSTGSVLKIVLSVLFFNKSLVAFSLWLQKDWAINYAIVDVILGIAFCAFMFFAYKIFGVPKQLRLEFLLLIPYLVQLIKIKPRWDRR